MSRLKTKGNSDRSARGTATEQSTLALDGSDNWREPTGGDSSLAYAIATGIFVVVSLAFFILIQPHPDRLDVLWWEIVFPAIQATISGVGWTMLGIATALLAAALTAVSIVGYRNSMSISFPKLESIRDTIDGLVYAATAISSGLAITYFLATVSLSSFDNTLTAWSDSTPTPASGTDFRLNDLPAEAEGLLESGLNSILLGFAALLLIMVALRINHTVDLWFRSDGEVHKRERDLLEQRNKNSVERIVKLNSTIGGVSRAGAIARAIFVAIPLSVLASGLLAWPLSLFVDVEKQLTFVGLVLTVALYLSAFITPLSLQFVTVILRGPLTQRLKAKQEKEKAQKQKDEIREARGRWTWEAILWGLGLFVPLLPVIPIYIEVGKLGNAHWWFVVLAVLIGIGPSAAFIIGIGRYLSWKVIAAFAARRELTLTLEADRLRLERILNQENDKPATKKPWWKHRFSSRARRNTVNPTLQR